MRQEGYVEPSLAILSKLLEVELELVDVISRQTPERPWGSEVYVVRDPVQSRKYVYKARRVFPYELVEIESVLTRLAEDHIPHFCPIVDFKLFNHRIHLLLEHVEGTSLDHSHDEHWNNEPSFCEYLGSLPLRTKVEIAYQLLEGLYELHQRSLLFQDLKIEQIILMPSHYVVVVDLDTIVLKGGLCASHVMWVSPVCPPPSRSCCESNDIYQAGCIIYELFTGKHLRGGEEIISSGEIDRVVRKMTNRSQEWRYTTAGEVLCDLVQIKDRMRSFKI